MDHNVATTDDRLEIKDPVSKAQVEALQTNCDEFGVTLYGMGSPNQGIVHVIGPELGITVPGLTVVCGDSHTLDARRVWYACLWYRYQRGRACNGDADPASDQAQEF